MGNRERDILERSVHAIAQQAANTNNVIDEAMEAGLSADHPVTVAAKQVRLELLKIKADLEGELGKLVSELHRLRPGGPLGSGDLHVGPLGTGGIASGRRMANRRSEHRPKVWRAKNRASTPVVAW